MSANCRAVQYRSSLINKKILTIRCQCCNVTLTEPTKPLPIGKRNMVGILYILLGEEMLNSGIVKPFLSYDDQLDLLESRGLTINDREYALSVLKCVNYYRFSGYSLTLRHNDVFYPGVKFDNVFELYLFDEQFRGIIMKYCGIVEISFRSYLSYYHSEKYTPLGYLSSENFEDVFRYSSFIIELDKDIRRSDDYFIQHHKTSLNNVFPFWVAIEVTSFGLLSKLYKNMKLEDRNSIAKKHIGFGRKYVENWLQCCTYVRNIAAHGGRFYNRQLKASPVRINEKRYPKIDNTSPFAFIIAIYNLLPSDLHKQKLIKELGMCYEDYTYALPKHLGFPDDWETLLCKD